MIIAKIDFKVYSNLDTIIPLLSQDHKLGQKAFTKIANDLKEAIKQKVPVKSGQLRDSIQSLSTPNLATVWSDLYYAQYVNYGTAPHDIFPNNAQSLSWLSGSSQIFAKSVSHPGSKAHPYFLTESGDVLNEYNNVVQKSINDMTFDDLFAK